MHARPKKVGVACLGYGHGQLVKEKLKELWGEAVEVSVMQSDSLSHQFIDRRNIGTRIVARYLCPVTHPPPAPPCT